MILCLGGVCLVGGVCYLGNEPLVLAQPRLSHGGFAVEAPRKLLQFLLANQLCPQSQFTLVLRPLQTLPRLNETQKTHSDQAGSGR